MRALVKPEWTGRTAYVLGGGSSLRSFDFEWIRGKCVIGVNDAFLKGRGICPRMIFSDHSWWTKNWRELENYWVSGGTVHSLCTELKPGHPWIMQHDRILSGLSSNPQALGWNRNTGAAALNLALLLGANRIFLLGFDMCKIGDRSHWHELRVTPEEVFQNHIKEFKIVSAQLAHWPDVEVLNVGDGRSRLPGINKISFKEMMTYETTTARRWAA